MPTDRRPAGWPVAGLAFTGACAIAGIWLMLVAGAGLTAERDDWRMVGARDWSDLLLDFNQHLSALPIALYKGLFALVGFHPFWPYRLLTVLCHLAIVVLVRSIMRRAGVRPWLATALAVPLLVFPGETIVVSQFQMPLAMALALVQVRCAMGPRGPWLLITAALCGTAALLSSGIALPVTAAAGLVAWRRWGFGRAALMLGPTAAGYLLWYGLVRPQAPEGVRNPAVPWILHEVARVPVILSGGRALAFVLLAGILAGLALAWRGRGSPGPRTWEPVVLTGAALVMHSATYLGRGVLPAGVHARFSYFGAALVMPLIALAAMWLMHSRWWLTLSILIPLGVGMVANVQAWRVWHAAVMPVTAENQAQLAAVLRSPAGPGAPDSVQPFRLTPFGLTGEAPWGFLRGVGEDRAGVVGAAVSPSHEATALLRLSLAYDGNGLAEMLCTDHDSAVVVEVADGDELGLLGPQGYVGRFPMVATLMRRGTPVPGDLVIQTTAAGVRLKVHTPPGVRLTLRFTGAAEGTFALCR